MDLLKQRLISIMEAEEADFSVSSLAVPLSFALAGWMYHAASRVACCADSEYAVLSITCSDGHITRSECMQC